MSALKQPTCTWCEHKGGTEAVLTRKPNAAGVTTYRWQCQSCFNPVGNAVKKELALAHNPDLPDFDEEAMAAATAQAEIDRVARMARFTAERDAANDDWWRRYEAHMGSPEWFAMRQKVLRRDKGLCQGCLEAKATEVHHETYSHMGCELAFQLVSLCRPCHLRRHNREENAQ